MTFPAYRPKAWPLQLGTYPASIGQTISGRTSTVRHSDVETDITLPLEFILTYAQFQDVWNHFQVYGNTFSFNIPEPTIPASYTPTGYRWRYAAEPVRVQDEHTDFFVVTITFIGNLWSDIQIPHDHATLRIVATSAEMTSVRTVAPAAPIATVQGLVSGTTPDGFVEVTGLQTGAAWEYSTNSGATWTPGTGSGFQLAAGSYSAGAIRVRQVDPDGNISSPAQNASAVAVQDASSVTIVATIASGATGTGTVALPRWFVLSRITSNRAGWFTLYGNAAGAAADVGRLRANDPGDDRHVIRDPVFTAPGTLWASLQHPASNAELPATNTYPWRFVNDGASGEVVITLNFLMLGAY
jgi:hypothetical protein